MIRKYTGRFDLLDGQVTELEVCVCVEKQIQYDVVLKFRT